MTSKMRLAWLPAVCLCWAAGLAVAHAGSGTARPNEPVAAAGAPTGRVTGVVRDPVGSVVAGAKIELEGAGRMWTRETNREGRFDFEEVPAGIYRLTVIVSGFEMVLVRDVRVVAGRETVVKVTLRIAPVKAEVEVWAAENETAAITRRTVDEAEQASSRNTAEIVAKAPGVSLRESGALAGVPMLHGLGDERTKVEVDGVTVSSACPNHMNPPLSYAAPAQAATVTVLAGITPVSLGGDSLSGTVVVEGERPVFAIAGERVHEDGAAAGFYRSNGEYYGGSVREWVAGHNVGMGYGAEWARNGDYFDGGGHKVTSTYAQSSDQTVTLAVRGRGNRLTLEAGMHHTPYEGFTNARMDLVRNFAESLNLQYRREFERGAAGGSAEERGMLEARVYWQGTWHTMNIGRDKLTFPMPMNMPMQTHGRDTGYEVNLDLPLGVRHTLRTGNELHRFRLDDDWPAVAGTAPHMGPNDFVSIDDGRRTRLGAYVEVASKWNTQWTTLMGARNDTVWMNAGPVHGYSSMYATDAAAFNAANRARTDVDMDATVLVRWEPNAAGTVEFGYARKCRAPNLYERYAWSTNWMASEMIGWFGDGNAYVGNLVLKPETANTVSGTVRRHGSGYREWKINATPYVTFVQNYVDVDTLATKTAGMSTFAQLEFGNHSARIYGGDLSSSAELWKSGRFGQGRIGGVAGWLHGERTDSSTPLYQMMPLNLRVNFDEEVKGFSGGVGVEAVDRKRNVDPRRFEQQTPGYALVNLHGEFRCKFLRVSAAGDNLLNKRYELPLGGVNMDDFLSGMQMGVIEPLTGRGRAGFFSLTARF